MIEIPESIVLADQINEHISGKQIMNVTAAQSPHKFAWYHGDPSNYHDLLTGKKINRAIGYGSLVEIIADNAVILFGDGVSLRYFHESEKRPEKHQLLIEFDDFSTLVVTIQMYGGLWCFKKGEFNNSYFLQAKEKPLPITKEFNEDYFYNMVTLPCNEKLSVKALLATEQRIPGLGNGVLQDILYNAGIHPKRKVKSLDKNDLGGLYKSIKTTLLEMLTLGGRNTEKDLFGCPGGYKTKLSKYTLDKPCSICGQIIRKEAYLGGSIYYCPNCQKIID